MNGSMNCQTFRKHCVELLDTNGDSRRHGDLRSHREKCPECARFLDEMSDTLHSLEPAREIAASARFGQRVMTRIAELESQAWARIDARRTVRNRIWKVALAAALLGLVAAAVAVMSDRSAGPKSHPQRKENVALSPGETVKAFLGACAHEDWAEAAKFWPQPEISAEVKAFAGGLKIVSVGKACWCDDYGAWAVPYEVRLKSGDTRKAYLAMQNDNPENRWMLDGRGLMRNSPDRAR